MIKGRLCSVGVWDESVPDITFNEKGESSYCQLQRKLMVEYPRGEKGVQEWQRLVSRMKKAGRYKKYDCLVGASGGTDSSYLLHVCKENGLRVLAVNVDNGWNSEAAVNNLNKMTRQLDFDLVTCELDRSNVQVVSRAYLKASLPWVDAPSDMAIRAVLYRIAKAKKIEYILNGSDFRTEGKQPFSWTYSDARQLRFLVKKNEGKSIGSFPALSYWQLGYLSVIRGIKVVRPLYFLDYSKQRAQQELKELYDWEDYGGHHYENIYTKFIMSYWLYEKFGIDKRKITLSAQIMNGDISREEALTILQRKPYDEKEIEDLKRYVLAKLDITAAEFDACFKSPNKFYYDYPNSYARIYKHLGFITFLSSKAMLYKPTSLQLRQVEKRR